MCTVLAMGAALLTTGGVSAVESSATVIAQPARSLPPQQNVPDLDVPGPPQTVTYPPDGKRRFHQSTVTIQAPPYTRITGLNLRCSWACPFAIAPDGKSATGTFNVNTWDFLYPYDVEVVADANANVPLAGGQFSGTFTLDGDTQPLTVNFKPGVQAVIAANLRNTNPRGGGVRVITVDPGSKADTSGLQPGDLIIDIAGTPTPTVNDLDTFLDQKRAGTTYPATVMRGGTTVTLQLTLDS
ncbi:PDZ domain-containing protein [Microbispora sp. NBC_01189]|uniref:PDZ domain-containing protein n=1 Tax=Microbispora sp. NBC_01189 TaxID=2903583 RepID=UPI002E0FAACF|nr:PDZ domain-containing protein [Microbispora sp. NBC_01189]